MSKREKALQIVKTLNDHGYAGYWVGGCVRDMLMGRDPHDYDIATNAPPYVVEKIFPRTVAVGKQFGVIVVLMNSDQFQVTTFRAESDYQDGRHPGVVTFGDPKADALRRDFTVNGMFYDPIKDEVIDYVGGQADLQAKLVRAIGAPFERFNEDYLRILRAIRFAAQLNFSIEPQTFEAITKCAHLITKVSAERVRDELLRLFAPPHAARGLELLRQTGLLKVILPEIADTFGCEQSPEYHPEGCVYTHILKMLEQLPNDASPTLVWAVLLHDVGKPVTARQNPDDDKKTFYGHDIVGAQIAREILQRLKFPNKEIEDIVICVQKHMQLKDAPRMKSSTLRKMLARPTFPIELELHRLDCLSASRDLSVYEFLRKQCNDLKAPVPLPPPLVKGTDLIALGFSQGPILGQVLKEIREKQLLNEIKTKEEALQFAKQFLDKITNKNDK